MKHILTYNLILHLIALGSISCSVEKTSGLSKAFHNTTSHYNAYYYANENIQIVESRIEESIKNDYDEILPIFAPIDSNLANSYEEQIEEAIKMASIGIQRHPNSKWVDDSYLLIGLARLYSLDFVNAINTFKYINTKSEDDNTRHLALIYLMRTFTDYGEYSNAVAVSDYLEKQKLNSANEKLLYIYRAYYFQKRNDLDNMLTSMVNAASVLGRRDGRGRFYFIVGQNYQTLGFNAEAHRYYQKCLGTNPEYELDFYARLNMAQVAELDNKSDIKNSRKRFKKLLGDKKNVEFRDKIYFEMAKFELKQNHIDLTLDHLNSSIRESQGNNKQKGLSYLMMGQLYYDSLRNFRNAQAYYDSCLTVLPKDHEQYESTAVRGEILNDFVTQLNTIELQDSLLYLATMDSAVLYEYLEAHVEEKRRLEEERKKKNKSQQRTSNNVFTITEEIGTGKWYFGNPTAVAMGETEFQRIWGNIPLEDNWRRSAKDQIGLEDESSNELTDNNSSKNGKEGSSSEDTIGEEVNSLFQSVPRNEEQKTKAHSQIEEAYYNLGKIYYFQLEESENGAQTFENLLEKYPENNNRIEVMYLLYLIYNQLESEALANKYKNILLTNYPKTTYSRLIINPNYTEETSAAAEQLRRMYDSAYQHFENGFYDTTKTIINQALASYDDLEVSNRFRLLSILITGKTENITLYQYQLGEFIKSYPDSKLTPYAKDLLNASRNFQDRLLTAKGVKFQEFFEQEHYVIVAYRSTNKITDALTQAIDKFNREKFPNLQLNASNLILGPDHYITMITEFAGAKSSLSYYERLMVYPDVLNALNGNKFDMFTITKDNFSIFYKTKELEAYLRFFNENY